VSRARLAAALILAATLLLPGAGCRHVIARHPRVLHAVAPAYPESARRGDVRGVVLLRVQVAADGSVSRVRVTRSIPEQDAAAVAAVRQWTCRPGTIGGRRVAVWITVPVRFAPRT
jgi:protein TonB